MRLLKAYASTLWKSAVTIGAVVFGLTTGLAAGSDVARASITDAIAVIAILLGV